MNQLIVLKENQPAAIILSPAEYNRFGEREEDYYLLMDALERIEKNGKEPAVSFEESMAKFRISREYLNSLPDPVIE